MRNNIDALVERVRAVAMADNRPSTPGSHIDWAGEDDDSLPDLDDWGVTPTGRVTDAMSPVGVDGLKSLPDVPHTPPPAGLPQEPIFSDPLAEMDSAITPEHDTQSFTPQMNSLTIGKSRSCVLRHLCQYKLSQKIIWMLSHP